MPTDPCTQSTPSILLETVDNPRALKASLIVAPQPGNPLAVGGDGVTAYDPWASDQAGVGVNDALTGLVTAQVPPTLGVLVTVTRNGVSSRSPSFRLPSAGNDPLRVASADWPDDDFDIKALQLAVADATNPRIDRIIATWGSLGQIDFQVKTGTPTASATLDNLLGGAAIDETREIRLADVLIDAGAVTIAQNKIRDRRMFLPDTGVMLPSAGIPAGSAAPLRPVGNRNGAPYDLLPGNADNHQVAALVALDRPVFANFFNWAYGHAGTGVTGGSWVLALYDSSRRFLCQSSPTAFINSGVAGNYQRIRAGIGSPRLLRPGNYYLLFGVTSISGAGGANLLRYFNPIGANTPLTPNAFYHRTAGSTNPPQGDFTAAGLVDTYTEIANFINTVLAVPDVAISSI